MEADQTLDSQFMDAPYTLVVAFHNNEPFYSPEEDLICQFSFKDYFCVDDMSECSLGLFRVGWENCQDAIVIRTIDQCDIFSYESEYQPQFKKGEIYEVKFPYHKLPRDDKDYQFCFLWQTSVLGASQPFQFQEEESSEASDIEIIKEGDLEWWYESSVKQPQNVESEEAVMVHNERTVLEETLGRVVEENSILKGWRKDAEVEIDGLRENLADLENQKVIIERVLVEKSNKITEQAQEISDLRTSVRSYEAKLENLVEKESHLKSRVQTLEKQLGEAEEEIRDLLNKVEVEKGKETGQIVQVYEMKLANFRELFQELEKELAEERMEKDEMAEKYLQEKEEFEAEMQALFSKVKSTEERVLEVSLEKEDLISKVLEENESYATCMKEKDTAIKHLELQMKEVKELNENLCESSERAIRELEMKVTSTIKKVHSIEEEREQLKSQLLAYRESSDTVNSLKSDIETMRVKEKDLTDAIRNIQAELQNENEKYQELKDRYLKSNGARHALKVAYAHVQKQIGTLRAEKEELARMFQSVRKQLGGTPSSTIIEEQNKKIEDLKLRLCMGLNAYKEKFVECRKLTHELQKARKSLTPQANVASPAGDKDLPWRSFSAALQSLPVTSAPDVTAVGSRQDADEKTLLKDEIEKLKTEHASCEAESEALRKEVGKLRTELDEAKSQQQQLTVEKASGAAVVTKDRSLNTISEDKKMTDMLTLEVRRLEDVVQAKDLEIKVLKQKMSDMNTLVDTPHTPITTFLEMKEKHRKNVDKLQQECDKYKKILLGVNKVIHGSAKKEEDTTNGEEISAHDDIKRPPMDEDEKGRIEIVNVGSSRSSRKTEKTQSEKPSTVLREPHMSPIRDVKMPPQIYRMSPEPLGGTTGAAMSGTRDVPASQPKDIKKRQERSTGLPPSPSQKFPYPWIYGNAGAAPPNYVPGSALRRPAAKIVDRRSEPGPESKSRSSRKHMEPVIRCPVCQLEFPPGHSDVEATKHVNAHFSG